MNTSSLFRFGPPLGRICLCLGLAALLSAAPPASHGAGPDLSAPGELPPLELANVGVQARVVQRGGLNTGEITQKGADSAASILQDGFRNRAGTSQSGAGNTAVIQQAGAGNDAQIIQAGMGIWGEIHQTGAANRGRLEQYASNSYANLNQIGNFNQLSVTLTTPGPLAPITQIGSGLKLSVYR
jgi:major curlin subunit